MNGYLIATILLLTIVDCALSDNDDAWRKIDQRFKKLDQLATLEKYMSLTSKWQKRLKSTSCFSTKSRSDSFLIENLEKLTLIKRELDEGECTGFSRRILNQLGETFEQANLQTLQKVYENFSMEFAINCREEYPKIYQKKMKHISKKALRRMRPFFLELFHSILRDPKRFVPALAPYEYYLNWASKEQTLRAIYTTVIINELQINSKIGAEIAYDTIIELLKQDPDVESMSEDLQRTANGEIILSSAAARELFAKLIDGSCSTYLTQVGPHLFALASADAKLLTSLELYSSDDYKLTDYYLAWAVYEGCKHLYTHRDEHDKLLHELGKLAQQYKGVKRKFKTTRDATVDESFARFVENYQIN